MIELGNLAAGLALGLCVVAVVAAILGARWDSGYTRVGRVALHATTLLLIFSCGTVVNAFLTYDFSVLYVAMNSNLRLPGFFRFAALWGGHEGSLLLWGTLLSIFSSLVVAFHWKRDPDFMAPIIGVLSAVLGGFLALILFLSSPFERLFPVPLDGRDLNPLLQDYQMVIHPPMLFLGYTGFAIPFAFAMAVLLTGRGADRWIFLARRWTLTAWVILTAGIALGGHWAYRELGWGGYWAWDPVENASFMPWLIGTALLHSSMVQEQRKTFRVWNLALAISAFALSISGTFLVRSGIISSVHAFASDPGRGIYLLAFFASVLLFSFGLLVAKASQIQTRIGLSGLSRESLFLYNNLFLVVGMLTVLLGTLFPLVSEVIAGTKVTVAAPFFNQTFVPIMIANMLFMSVAPLLPWRKFTGAQVKKVVLIPAAVAMVAGLALFAYGIHKPISLIALMCSAFGLTALLREWAAGAWARSRGSVAGLGGAFVRMFLANRRRYGGLLAHLGMLVLAIGFVGSGAYQTESDVSLAKGERTQIGSYELIYTGMKAVTGANWSGFSGHFDILRNGKKVAELDPEKRFYARSEMPTTEPQRFKNWTHELYVTMGDVDRETGAAVVKIYLNPLVQLVWAGVIILVLGGFLSLTHRVRFGRTT